MIVDYWGPWRGFEAQIPSLPIPAVSNTLPSGISGYVCLDKYERHRKEDISSRNRLITVCCFLLEKGKEKISETLT